MSLTPPPTSVDEAFGLWRETTFGTGVTSSVWFYPISNQFKRQQNKLAMAGATGGVSRFRHISSGGARIYEGTTNVSGPVSFHAEFDDIGHLFSAMWGVPTFAGPTDSAYTHTWTLPRTIPTTPTSLSCARVNALEDLRMVGSLPNRMTLRGTQGGIIVATFDMVAQGGGDAEVTDAPTEGFSTAPWMEFPDCQLRWTSPAGTASGSLTNQTGAKSIRSWECVFDNNLRVEQAAGDAQRGPREFTYNGTRPATLSVTRDNADDQFFNDMMSATTDEWFNTVEMAITSEQVIGAGTTPYSMAIYAPSAALLGETPEFGGSEGVTPETVNWEFADNGSAAISTITLVNGTGGGGAPYGA